MTSLIMTLTHVENSSDKRKKNFKFFLPNSDHCILKGVRAKLSVWSGLKRGKSLFHACIMLWADIISNDALKCSTSLKNPLTCCADKKGENYVSGRECEMSLKVKYITKYSVSLFRLLRWAHFQNY